MADEDRADEAATAALFLNEARWRRDDQVTQLAALERKLVTAFTLNVAVIALFSASLGIAVGPFPLTVECMIYATIFLFIVGVAVSAGAYLSTAWTLRPDLDHLSRLSEETEPVTLTNWLATEIVSGLTENERVLKVKTQLVALSVLLAASTAAMVGATAAVYSASRFF